jgi:hypothetical protein
LVLRLGLTTLLDGSITITSPLLLVMVMGDGTCLVFMVRFLSTPRGAVIIELISYLLFDSGKRVSEWGFEPHPPFTPNLPDLQGLARLVCLSIYRVI